MSTRKQQAPRLARPAARYWKGKAPKGLSNVASDSDSDSDGERDVHPEQPGDIPISGEQDIAVARDEDEDDEWEGEGADIMQTRREVRVEVVGKGKGMNVSLKDVNISRDGKVIVAGREESGRTVMEVDGAFSRS
jgi:microfibrillar-associated protein 1